MAKLLFSLVVSHWPLIVRHAGHFMHNFIVHAAIMWTLHKLI